MSATSFGEYKPVQRSTDDSTYTLEKLMEHNGMEHDGDNKLKARNRRIEILLFYRFDQAN